MTVAKIVLPALLASTIATGALAADYSDNIRKNDGLWLQLNLMQSLEAKIPGGAQNDTYIEAEFGGRSGFLDLYGYVDLLDVLSRKDSGDNMFLKLAPRLSLDAILGTDLSFGPVKELYLATMITAGDNALFNSYIGLGSDIQVPWLGKIGMNLYGRYVVENYGAANEKKWDGYLLSTTWSKPLYTFSNGTYINYQGYLNYAFGAAKLRNDGAHASKSVEWYNGIYWHAPHFAIGYGLKAFHNMALAQHKGPMGETTGVGHYFQLTYKF